MYVAGFLLREFIYHHFGVYLSWNIFMLLLYISSYFAISIKYLFLIIRWFRLIQDLRKYIKQFCGTSSIACVWELIKERILTRWVGTGKGGLCPFGVWTIWVYSRVRLRRPIRSRSQLPRRSGMVCHSGRWTLKWPFCKLFGKANTIFK